MRIRSLKLDGNIILAPLAGYSNWPMRILCRRMGAALVFTEMVSANSLVLSRGRGKQRTERLLKSKRDEKPLGVQIFGADPDIMAEAAAMVQEKGADLIDLNLGCSVKKVVKSGAGAALLREPELARNIFRKVRKAVRIPLTIKIRAGWDRDSINAPEIARMAQDEGVDAVTIHARVARQLFSRPADWSLIAQVVKAVGIPVIGNGDVRSRGDAGRMMDETGCAGVMIGRAARGNPWIFRLVEEGNFSPDSRERHEVVAEHYRMLTEHLGDRLATVQMRKHIAWYSKGMPEAAEFRQRINRAQNPDQVWHMINEYFGQK